MSQYIPNAGQTYQTKSKNIHIPFLSFERPAKPDPLLEPLILRQAYMEKGFILARFF